MYTLKIQWSKFDPEGTLVDEAIHFIPATEVVVQGPIMHSLESMGAWEPGSFYDYKHDRGENARVATRLVQVKNGDFYTWYVVSRAWLLGPDGSTIEKLI